MDRIDVNAKWIGDDQPYPTWFAWQGLEYSIENLGRRWEDEAGLHILCAVKGGQVFELIYKKAWGWSLGKKPAGLFNI
jgi:hypothetical protein